jgi:hypothetical protein
MQEEHNKEEKAHAEQKAQPDTDRIKSANIEENDRTVPSDKEINLSDEDQALDSGI